MLDHFFRHAIHLNDWSEIRRPPLPLKPKHVWAIRVRLEIAENHRDLALFNTAIDSKLRGCDLVVLKVADVYAAGQIKERTSVLQSKTQKPVRFELTEGTRTSLVRWLDDPMMVGHSRRSPIVA